FFLGALAVVLAGFSVSLYLLAEAYLDRQVDERLAAALETLAATIDADPKGLEWEPQDRNLTLGRDPAADQVRWAVHDAAGRPVGRPVAEGGAAGPARVAARAGPGEPDGGGRPRHGRRRPRPAAARAGQRRRAGRPGPLLQRPAGPAAGGVRAAAALHRRRLA